MVTKAKETAEATQAAVEQLAALLGEDTFSSETLNPALGTLFSEMGVGEDGEAVVHVSMLNADNKGVEANIWKGDPDSYDLEQLARKFGSGSYRVKVYVRIPTGQRVKKADKVFAWKLSPDDEARRTAPHPSAGGGISAQEVAGIVADSLRLAGVGGSAAPVQNPLDMITAFAQVAKMLQPPPPPPPPDPMQSLTTMVTLMGAMRDLQPEREPLEQGRNAGIIDLLLPMVKNFGPQLAGLLQQNQGQPPQPMQNPVQLEYPPLEQGPLPPNVVPIQNANPPAPTQQETEDMNVLAQQQLKMGIGFLLNMAKAGAMPETYADVVIDNVPADALNALLSEPDPVAWLAAHVPEVSQHAEWFKAMIAELKSIMSDAEQPEQVQP